MIGIFLLLLVAAWLGWPYLQDFLTEKRGDDRRFEKINYRRQILAQAPHSPAAYEQLGDALREADRLQEAVDCYEKAMELEGAVAGGGAGYIGGSGVEHKLKLTSLELSERYEPEKHGRTLKTRQQVCGQCGNLANPGDKTCATCGSPLPVDNILDTIRDPNMREILVREGKEFAAIMAVITVALFLTGFMTYQTRGVIFFASVIVLAFRFLKRIGPD